MKIEVVGPGCPRCKATGEAVKKAVEELGISAEISHIYDFKEIAQRGVTFTPAVIVDGVVKISGKVPSVEEVKQALSS